MSELSNKLNRAKAQLFGTAAAEIKVPFQLECECGHRVAGIRQPGSQTVECSQCHTEHFVLPVNVYPTTRRVPSEVLGGNFRQRLFAVIGELIPRKPPTVDRRPKTERPVGKPVGGQEKYSEAGPASAMPAYAETGRSLQEPTSESSGRSATNNRPDRKAAESEPIPALKPRVPLSVRIRRQFTVFRLMMFAVVIVVVSTAAWMIHRRQLEQARIAWRSAMDETTGMLEEAQFGELEQLLVRADAAATKLGRNDAEVGAVRNLLRQTQAINGLNSDDLFTEISSAYSRDGRLEGHLVDGLCRDLCTGWHVFECRLLPYTGTESGSVPVYTLEFPARIHQDQVQILTDSSVLGAMVSADPQSPILFAASIESCRGADGVSQSWMIKLKSESCALITTVEHAEQFGLSPESDPQLSAIIDRQKQFVEANNVELLLEKDREIARAAAQRQEKQQ